MSDSRNEMAKLFAQLASSGADTEEVKALYSLALDALGKAETLDFVISAGMDENLGEWVSFVSDSIEQPSDLDGTVKAMGYLLERAKADGVYPIKPKV